MGGSAHFWHEKQFQMVQDISSTRENPYPDCRHYPRPVMGKYLKARFREKVSEEESMGIIFPCMNF